MVMELDVAFHAIEPEKEGIKINTLTNDKIQDVFQQSLVLLGQAFLFDHVLHWPSPPLVIVLTSLNPLENVTEHCTKRAIPCLSWQSKYGNKRTNMRK